MCLHRLQHLFVSSDALQNIILGGIRTRDLRIRSPTRYPLRYEDWVLELYFTRLVQGYCGNSRDIVVTYVILENRSYCIYKSILNQKQQLLVY